MTPQEKADELIRKYYRNSDLIDEDLTWTQAKECALIAIDEIIKAIDFDWMEVQNLNSQHRYWQQVKQEIEKYD